MSNGKHATAEQLRGLMRRELNAEELLKIGDHLAECGECRVRAAAAGDEQRVMVALTADEHLSYEDLEALVNADSEPTGHVARCAMCAAELQDLRAFRGSLTTAPKKPFLVRHKWTTGVLAVAAAVVLVVALRRPAEPVRVEPRATASLTDAGVKVSLGPAGNVLGLPDATPDDMMAISKAMSTGELPRSRLAASLMRQREVLLSGDGAKENTLRPVAPVGTAVVSDRPQFSWSAVAGARWYRVAVYGADFEQLAVSEKLQATEWQPAKALPRGVALSWTVTASLASGEITAPRAPEPEAKFQAIAAEDAARMEELLRRVPRPELLIAIRASELGLVDDARQAADRLAAQNPGSALVQRLREAALSSQ